MPQPAVYKEPVALRFRSRSSAGLWPDFHEFAILWTASLLCHPNPEERKQTPNHVLTESLVSVLIINMVQAGDSAKNVPQQTLTLYNLGFVEPTLCHIFHCWKWKYNLVENSRKVIHREKKRSQNSSLCLFHPNSFYGTPPSKLTPFLKWLLWGPVLARCFEWDVVSLLFTSSNSQLTRKVNAANEKKLDFVLIWSIHQRV